MLSYPQLSRWIMIVCVLFSVTSSATAGDSRELARQAKAAIRAAENTNDAQLKNTKLDEARKLIDQIKAGDPQNAELRSLESKYRYMNTGREATKAAARTPEGDTGKLKEVLDDWNVIIKLDKDLYAKTNPFFPHAVGMSYTKEQMDQVLSVMDDVVKNDQPRILAYLKEFSKKYGEPNDEMDKKIYALTPKNPKKGMYDEENQRPSELPSECYKNLMDRLTWVQEGLKKEAKLIMKQAMEMIANADFFQDTKRDKQFVEAEAELNRAKRFIPMDAEIARALGLCRQTAKSHRPMSGRRLSPPGFRPMYRALQAPGRSLNWLQPSGHTSSEHIPRRRAAVSVSGGWVATKHNILGQPIQWGLPVFCASQQNEPGICRVFKMTVLTGVGVDIAKAPPFTDHWTGDSYRMMIVNLK